MPTSAPVIATQPLAITNVSLGENFTLTVVATGTGLSYQWNKDGDSLGSTGTSPSYSVASVTTNDIGTYSVVVTNARGSVTSDHAVVNWSIPNPYAGFRPGDVAWSLPLDSNPLPASAPSGATWLHPGPSGKDCVQIISPILDRTKTYGVSLPVDLSLYRGAQITLTCLVKAQDVTQPVDTFNGVKVQLGFDSASSGHQSRNLNNVYGTFDWQSFSYTLDITSDASNGTLLLGFQGCGGTAWIADVTITIVHPAPHWPAIDPSAPALPRGHVPLRGMLFPDVLRTPDFPDLKAWNVNIIRWIMDNYPVDMAQVSMADFDLWVDAEIVKLDETLVLAKANGQKVIIAMFDSPGGRETDGTLRMLYDAKFGDHFIAAWQKLASRYKGNSAVFAYGLINEPVQSRLVPQGQPDFLQLQLKAAQAIRQIDRDTPIMIAADGFDSPPNFAWMPTVDIPNVIYEVHMYYPHSFTHQGVYNTWGDAGGDPVVTYPGTLDGTPTGKPLNKDALIAWLKPVRDFQLANRVPIFLGEFSAARWAPGAAQYLQDCIDIFEGYGWDWIYCCFRSANCWSLELENQPYDVKGGVKATTPTDRLQVMCAALSQNQSPY